MSYFPLHNSISTVFFGRLAPVTSKPSPRRQGNQIHDNTPIQRQIFIGIEWLICCVVACLFSLPGYAAPSLQEENDAINKRTAEILNFVSDDRATAGMPSDRAGWERLAALPQYENAIRQAEEELKTPIPELPEELYREFSVNGNRSNYQNVYGKVRSRLSHFAFAEGIENKGRFIPALEETIRFLCDQPSWLLPAHDYDNVVYDGKMIYSDLVSTDLGCELAVTARWFQDKLSPEVYQLIVDNVEKRVLIPYEQNVREQKLPKVQGMWWVRGSNNWNAVCHAATVGAALYLCESKERRAWYIASAEYFSEQYFLPQGFLPDGYCSEGIGYWNYGFGNYISLNAFIGEATDYKVDLLRFPIIRSIAFFAPNMELVRNQFGAFADCSLTARPSALFVGYLSRALHLNMTQYEQAGLNDNFKYSGLVQLASLGFDNHIVFATPDDSQNNDHAAVSSLLPVRTEFPNAGVLICRPDPNVDGPYFAAIMKGGTNGEHHNHNDIGSYSLLFGSPDLKQATHWISQDPGGETYTRRTFSSQRYEGELLNSYGHPVPRVNGKLQIPSGKAVGIVKENSYTDSVDRFKLDITSAYGLPELKLLERLFIFTRATNVNAPAFEIQDYVEFQEEKNGEFETAIITFEKPEILPEENGTLRLVIAGVLVSASAKDQNNTVLPLSLESTIVGKDDPSVPKKPARLAFKITEPVQKATVTTHFEPVSR